jgi:hypothetical protein
MIQYAATFVLDRRRPGVLDRPVKPGDDSCGMGYDSSGMGYDDCAMGRPS